jgi:hypothetical protein
MRTLASGWKRRTAHSATCEVTRYMSTCGCTHSRCGVASRQNTTCFRAGHRAAIAPMAEAPVAKTEMARSAGWRSRYSASWGTSWRRAAASASWASRVPGRSAAAAPGLAAEVAAAGHEIAVHGWDHRYLTLRSRCTSGRRMGS